MSNKKKIIIEANWPNDMWFNAFISATTSMAQELQSMVQDQLIKDGIDKTFTVKVEVDDPSNRTMLGSISFSDEPRTAPTPSDIPSEEE